MMSLACVFGYHRDLMKFELLIAHLSGMMFTNSPGKFAHPIANVPAGVAQGWISADEWIRLMLLWCWVRQIEFDSRGPNNTLLQIEFERWLVVSQNIESLKFDVLVTGSRERSDIRRVHYHKSDWTMSLKCWWALNEAESRRDPLSSTPLTTSQHFGICNGAPEAFYVSAVIDVREERYVLAQELSKKMICTRFHERDVDQDTFKLSKGLWRMSMSNSTPLTWIQTHFSKYLLLCFVDERRPHESEYIFYIMKHHLDLKRI